MLYILKYRLGDYFVSQTEPMIWRHAFGWLLCHGSVYDEVEIIETLS